MKEHPDYKYRPRRKPKPLSASGSPIKKEAAKYSFPLPLIPPGFDPCTFSAAMARSILTSPFHPHDSNFIPLTPPAVAVSSSGASVGKKKEALEFIPVFQKKIFFFEIQDWFMINTGWFGGSFSHYRNRI